ncbi:hypothetical protein HY993_01255, partial [Candidatus Micrarchaeota archaeon]|nr:hypothetical protein [Candidatus Micrarchaeota archaeon]
MKVWHANSYVTEKTKGLKGGYAGHYLNTYNVGNKTFLSRVAFIYGPQADKMIDSFRNEPRITVEEVEGNQLFFTMPANKTFHTLVMSPGVYFLKPIVVEDGLEYWTVGSTKKEQ